MRTYETLILRNSGYIPDSLQSRIKESTILIAGCGIGSTIAEVALRTGFINIILLDGDTVEPHNLNRQIYTSEDVGTPKVFALKKRLLEIYPKANIEAYNEFLNKKNIKKFVEKCDIIFDTIDFLDLPAITYLHDEAFKCNKPIISAVSIGWGAGSMVFNVTKNKDKCCGFRKMFGLPEKGSVDSESYTKNFKPFVESLSSQLNPEVVNAMSKALTVMEDGTPCPAPHLSIGSFSVGAMAVSTAIKFLAKETLVENKLIILDFLALL